MRPEFDYYLQQAGTISHLLSVQFGAIGFINQSSGELKIIDASQQKRFNETGKQLYHDYVGRYQRNLGERSRRFLKEGDSEVAKGNYLSYSNMLANHLLQTARVLKKSRDSLLTAYLDPQQAYEIDDGFYHWVESYRFNRMKNRSHLVVIGSSNDLYLDRHR